MSPSIYLDYAATTAVDPAVAAAIAACLERDGIFANPSSSHAAGRRALAVIERARASVAERIGSRPERIVFTSGATEANNLALQGFAAAAPGRHLITAATEHKSILDTAGALEKRGLDVTYLPPGAGGRIEPGQVAAAIRDDTALVSIMHVNNETGVVQDVAEITRLCHARGVACHVDAAQSVGKVPVDVERWRTDMVSLTAHKVYGPKGIGALYVRAGTALAPLLHGGEQQGGLRPGTLPTHQIAGMGEAYALADPAREGPPLRRLSDALRQGLAGIDDVRFAAAASDCAPHIVNASFPGVDGESLRLAIAEIAVSAGSACASDVPEPSHVLSAIGLSDALAASSLRFSVGRWTTPQEIETAVGRLAAEIARLRALGRGAPAWCSA